MENELYHHGIKGMKWGIRRYQNPDGSLTNAGKKKYGTKTNFEKVKAAKKAAKEGVKERNAREKANARTAKEVAKYRKKAGFIDSKKTQDNPKSLSEMTNNELQSKIDRARLENTYKELYPAKVSSGKKFVNSLKDKAVSTIMDKGSKVAGEYLEKKAKGFLGLNESDPAAKLKKQAEIAGYEKKIAEAKAYIDSQKIKTTPTKNLIGDISGLTDQQLKDMINRINDENNLIRKLADRG